MLPVFYSDTIDIPLPTGHPFPQTKYRLLRERAQTLANQRRIELLPAEPIDTQALLRVHAPEYVERALGGGLTAAEQRELGFPWSAEYAVRACCSVGATVAAAERALASGWAVHLAGGTHHAFVDRGRGFCLFNDVAVAIHQLRHSGHAPRVLIVDLDVHQGDGTASLLADDPQVFTLSIHGARNYPRVKVPGDLDVALGDHVDDDAYLAALEPALDAAWQACRPEWVFYLAGADPLATDKYGKMALTKQGLAERDRQVLERCRAAGVHLVTVMGGGYSRDIRDTVDGYYGTLLTVLDVWDG